MIPRKVQLSCKMTSDSDDDEIYFDVANVLQYAKSLGREREVKNHLKSSGMDRFSYATLAELSEIDSVLNGALWRKSQENTIYVRMPETGKLMWILDYAVERREERKDEVKLESGETKAGIVETQTVERMEVSAVRQIPSQAPSKYDSNSEERVLTRAPYVESRESIGQTPVRRKAGPRKKPTEKVLQEVTERLQTMVDVDNSRSCGSDGPPFDRHLHKKNLTPLKRRNPNESVRKRRPVIQTKYHCNRLNTNPKNGQITLSMELFLRQYVQKSEYQEVYNMRLGIFDSRLIVFCPIEPLTLRSWLSANIGNYPASKWRSEVEAKLRSSNSYLLDLLPLPGIDTDLGDRSSRFYNGSILHLSIVLSVTLGNIPVDDLIGPTPIMGLLQSEIYDFLVSFCCFGQWTDGRFVEEDVNLIPSDARRLMCLIFGDYSKFAGVEMIQRGLNIASEAHRKDFHARDGPFNYKFRNESLNRTQWKNLESYSKERYISVETPLRQVSYAIISQGFLTIPTDRRPNIECIEGPRIPLRYRYISFPLKR